MLCSEKLQAMSNWLISHVEVRSLLRVTKSEGSHSFLIQANQLLLSELKTERTEEEEMGQMVLGLESSSEL